jgi:hypothetical protein
MSHKITILLSLSFLVAFLTLSDKMFSSETQHLESRDLIMILEKTESSGNQGIRLVSLVDKRSGHVFCSTSARPLFSLILCPPDTKKQTYANADKQWNHVEMEKKENILHLSWKGYTGIDGAEQVTVTMQIVADPEKDGIEISQTAQAGSDRISIVAMRLGQIAVRDFGADTKLFFPFRSGLVVNNPVGKNFNRRHGYPGAEIPMPWFVIWNEKSLKEGFRETENVGLYIGFHDSDGSRKVVECISAADKADYQWQRSVSFWATIFTENTFEPNNDFKIGGKAVFRSITNDWYDGAKIYRDWVRKEASWFPRDKMDENGRTDSPQWIKEHSLWAMYRVNPDEMIPVMKKFRDAFGVPAAVHWYYWHKNTYDNDYPHFVPREGFKKAVDEIQKDGDIFVMPYVNGLLWDSRDRGLEDWLYTKEGRIGAVKQEDGSVALHRYGSKESDGSDVMLAHMCPATEIWQRKIRENVLKLTNECGTMAVYVDQVAACTPELCYDRKHGHPLGGGHWWKDGYQIMFDTIRSDLKKTDLQDYPLCDSVRSRLRLDPNALRECAITSECIGETSLSIVDGLLTWYHQLENQVPAFAAVYGGVVQMFGRDYRGGKTKTYAERTAPRMNTTNEPLACRMKTAESLCFGEQIGWFVPTIIDEADKFPFQRKAVRLRYQLRHYFYKGEMCRVPEFPAELPKVKADWNWYEMSLVTAPAIRTGCWRILKNGRVESAVVLFANTSSDPITSRVRINLSEIGFDEATSLNIRRIGSEGFEKEEESNVLQQPILFPKECVFAWEITKQK